MIIVENPVAVSSFRTGLAILWLLWCCEGCGKKNENGGGFTVPDRSELEQVLAADQSSVTISFTADSEWYASIEAIPVARDNSTAPPDWISFSQNNGGPGDFTLTLSVQKNLTGTDRSARITLTGADDGITVIVTQKGVTEEGDLPDVRFLKTVTRRTSAAQGTTESVMEFTYDDQHRVTGIRFSTDGQAEYETVLSHKGNSTNLLTTDARVGTLTDATVHLNAHGYVSSGLSDTKDSVTGEIILSTSWVASYTDDNRLTRITLLSSGPEGEPVMENFIFTWRDGNLAAVLSGDGPGFTAEYREDLSNPGESNADFNLIALGPEVVSAPGIFIPAMLGYYGERSGNLLKRSEYGENSGVTEYAFSVDTRGHIAAFTANSSATGTTDYSVSYR